MYCGRYVFSTAPLRAYYNVMQNVSAISQLVSNFE